MRCIDSLIVAVRFRRSCQLKQTVTAWPVSIGYIDWLSVSETVRSGPVQACSITLTERLRSNRYLIAHCQKLRLLKLLMECSLISPCKLTGLVQKKSVILYELHLCGYETWSLSLREEQRLRVLWEYLDLRGMKWQEARENCITGNFIICTLHQIIVRWLY
jgi:hypothetical protein